MRLIGIALAFSTGASLSSGARPVAPGGAGHQLYEVKADWPDGSSGAYVFTLHTTADHLELPGSKPAGSIWRWWPAWSGYTVAAARPKRF